MNKKMFSKFLVLTLVVGIFGLVSATRVLAVFNTPSTTTEIGNVVPVITVQPAESWTQAYTGSGNTTGRSESSATYPTNMGTLVTFTGEATDVNLDQYYMIVCATAGVTTGNNAAPSCSGTLICVSDATDQDAPASCTKSTDALALESYTWYAYACDKNAAGLCSAASLTSEGGLNDEVDTDAGGPDTATPNGSPYHVNHIPSFTAATITDGSAGSIQPGETLKFSNSADADGDTNAAQDTITLYVCSGESDTGGVTSAFDFEANTCTGGTLLCTQTGVNPASADATCNDTQNIVSVPTAHATDYTVKYYVEDQHSFSAAAVESKDFTVTDVDPVLTGWTTTDAINGTIVAGLSDDMAFSASFTDDNGDMDVTNVEGRFFDKAVATNTCTADENDCYIHASCTLTGRGGAGSGKTAMGATNDYGADCTVTVWFNANASTNWEFHVNPTDSTVVKTGLADTDVNKVVAALSGIGVTEASIAYGTVGINDYSVFGATTQTDLENQGNQVIDVLLQGTNMTSGGNNIPAAQQKYKHATGTNAPVDFDWTSGGGFALLTSSGAGDETNGCLNRDLAVRAVHGTGTENEGLAWKIKIPSTQASGSYTGTNTFAYTSSSSCTGTGY